jgi:hypothetical protein
LILSEKPKLNEILAIEGDIAKESYNFLNQRIVVSEVNLSKREINKSILELIIY